MTYAEITLNVKQRKKKKKVRRLVNSFVLKFLKLVEVFCLKFELDILLFLLSQRRWYESFMTRPISYLKSEFTYLALLFRIPFISALIYLTTTEYH